MSFRIFHDFNLETLFKQGWRVMNNDNFMIVKCLETIYFFGCNFLTTSIGYCANYTWRNILQAHAYVIEKGSIWRA